MSNLKDAIPETVFENMFKTVRKNVVADTKAAFLSDCKKHIASVGLFVWDEMVHRGMVTDPTKIGPYIYYPSDGLIEIVESELGESCIRDVYAVEYFNEHDSKKPFAEIVLAHIWPNDIHLVDVLLADNRRPVSPTDPSSEFRNFHGLGAFDALMDGIKAVAKAKGASRASLLVAYPPLFETFSKRGFRVGPSEMAQVAFEHAKQGYPMVMDL